VRGKEEPVEAFVLERLEEEALALAHPRSAGSEVQTP